MNWKRTYRKKKKLGEFDLESSRDRAGSFEPLVLPKRQVIITEELEEKVIGLYGLGLSTRDISKHIKELYQMDISASTLSSITGKVVPAMNELACTFIGFCLCLCLLDCMHYKVREGSSVITRAVYNILGVSLEGKKELLGMYLSESEGAKFWLAVFTDLKNRGMQDRLIACVDGLKGFPEAIAAIFPKTEVQPCVVHQIWNSPSIYC